MINALVTKLKGEVNNDTLPIFGVSSLFFRNDVSQIPQNFFGCKIVVSAPIILTVEGGSYFTNNQGSTNLGTTLDYDGTSYFYVKKLEQEARTKVNISNKYVVTSFLNLKGAWAGTTTQTAAVLDADTLSSSTDIETIVINGVGSSNFSIPDSFGRLVKLSSLDHSGNVNLSKYNIHDLATTMIANGRDYTTHPTLTLVTGTGYTRYYNGTNNPTVPTNTSVIVFKSGGYELHSDTASGTLLYDSTL